MRARPEQRRARIAAHPARNLVRSLCRQRARWHPLLRRYPPTAKVMKLADFAKLRSHRLDPRDNRIRRELGNAEEPDEAAGIEVEWNCDSLSEALRGKHCEQGGLLMLRGALRPRCGPVAHLAWAPVFLSAFCQFPDRHRGARAPVAEA